MREYRWEDLPESIAVNSIVTLLKHKFPPLEPGREIMGESHGFPELQYIERGEHTVKCGEESITLYSGDLIIFPPGVHHCALSSRGADAYIISFFARLPDSRLFGRAIHLDSEERKRLASLAEQGAGIFVKRDDGHGGMVVREGVDSLLAQRVKKELELFLADLYVSPKKEAGQVKSRYGEHYERVRAYLKDKIGENPTLDRIARDCRMSRSTLKLAVRSEYGGGVTDMLLEMKTERARELLHLGELTVTEIAESLGFSSVHYFSRVFKARVGTSPTEYAKSNR